MTNPQPHPASPPTPKQLSYLRDLALGRGQSFSYPKTSAEASREIERLRKARRTSRADRRREAQAVGADMARRRGDAASIRGNELTGYGSTATWSKGP